jgi:putative transposase
LPTSCVKPSRPVTEICREAGISQQTFYRWKRKFEGMGVAELRRLKQLEKENTRLKQLVADLTLDKHMLMCRNICT